MNHYPPGYIEGVTPSYVFTAPTGVSPLQPIPDANLPVVRHSFTALINSFASLSAVGAPIPFRDFVHLWMTQMRLINELSHEDTTILYNTLLAFESPEKQLNSLLLQARAVLHSFLKGIS